MLSKIRIRNFRGIKSCEINDLGNVNIFIGKNNSGKSSILDALCLAKSLFNDRLFDEPILRLLLQRKGAERTNYTLRSFWHNYDTQENIQIYLDFANHGGFNFEVSWGDDSQLFIYLAGIPSTPSIDLSVVVSLGKKRYISGRGLNISGGYSASLGLSLERVISGYPGVLEFFRELAFIDDYLARKLEKLETRVFYKILEPRLDKDLARYLNEIYDMNAQGLTYIPSSPQLERHFVSAILTPKATVHIDELGDGAKYAVTILSLCLILQNSALLIEEIESHQHVGALIKLLPYLIRISKERHLQLFITTHSLEVIQALSSISNEFDIRFFHVRRNEEGDVTVKPIPSIDVRVLLDLGIDLRLVDVHKKFIVVEGNDDAVFIESLLEKYGRNILELGYPVKAKGKEKVMEITALLLSTGKDILVLIDYDDRNAEDLINSLSEVIKNRDHNVKIQQADVHALKIDDRITVTLVPMGLPDDRDLKLVGITWHEMEDYCLKLVEIDEKVKEWAGFTVKELVEAGKSVGLKGANKSSTALQVLALKKGMPYEEMIKEIIKRSNPEAVGRIIPKILREIVAFQ